MASNSNEGKLPIVRLSRRWHVQEETFVSEYKMFESEPVLDDMIYAFMDQLGASMSISRMRTNHERFTTNQSFRQD